ncbi:MAG TPA: hypothetical protein VJZ71_04135 [Phycisphaerae bacterium]|nr:hypothetical protein [Phycisphaerae bacterium]
MLLITVAAAGCQRPAPPESPTASTITDEDVQPLWDTALAVLIKHDFRPDRQDRTAGIITTHPTTSKQWHEPWRQDVADSYSLGEASLHTVQRQATVRFIRHPKDQPPAADNWAIEVQVDIYRLSVPEYQITSSSSAIRSFNADLPTVTGEKVADARAARRWVPLGRDGAMEERLLSRILASY